MHTILLTMVSVEEAEDLGQDVAIAALRALPTLQQPEAFPAWLCAIARNTGRSALERHRAAPQMELDEHNAPAAPPTEPGDAAEAILATIRRLPACYREPLTLRLVLELSGPEIAAQTGMTEGSVRVNLCRGMKLLRQRLQGEV